MKSLKFGLLLAALAFALGALNGCAAVGVNVWQHDILAQPEMQFEHQSVNQSMDDHVYFSKEASSGGRGFGGGGCGCN